MEYLAIPTAAHICGSVYNFSIFSPIGIFDVSHVSVGKKFRLDSHNAYAVFPRIIAGGDYLFFRPKRAGRLFQILLNRSRALNIFPFNKKIITSNKTEHGLFKRSKFSSLINFHCVNRHWSVLLDQVALQPRTSTWQKGWGDYLREAIILNISGSREAINRGTAIIRGNKVPKQF